MNPIDKVGLTLGISLLPDSQFHNTKHLFFISDPIEAEVLKLTSTIRLMMK